MYQSSLYIFSGSGFGDMTVTVTNLIAGAYNFYLYGHGNADNQNSVFTLTAGPLSYGTEATTNGPRLAFGVAGRECSMEFTNVSVSVGQVVTISMEPGGSSYEVLSVVNDRIQSAAGFPFYHGPTGGPNGGRGIECHLHCRSGWSGAFGIPMAF